MVVAGAASLWPLPQPPPAPVTVWLSGSLFTQVTSDPMSVRKTVGVKQFLPIVTVVPDPSVTFPSWQNPPACAGSPGRNAKTAAVASPARTNCLMDIRSSFPCLRSSTTLARVRFPGSLERGRDPEGLLLGDIRFQPEGDAISFPQQRVACQSDAVGEEGAVLVDIEHRVRLSLNPVSGSPVRADLLHTRARARFLDDEFLVESGPELCDEEADVRGGGLGKPGPRTVQERHPPADGVVIHVDLIGATRASQGR